jgi:drug/metabolite transporter (DMT)-like permease
MAQSRNKQALGIVLVLVGLLFLLVTNKLLWFGWSAVWPLFLILGGVFFLKVFAAGKNPDLLFSGLASLLLGLFFMLFTTGILLWEKLAILWPTFPLIGGIALMAMSAVSKEASGSLIVGIVAVAFSIACYTYAAGTLSPRVVTPFVRLWPLVLIIIGIVVFLKAKREEFDAGPDQGGASEKPSIENTDTD